MDLQSHFSCYSAYNYATTFGKIKKIIHWIYENNLFIKYGIIYDTTDGYRKQYIFEN